MKKKKSYNIRCKLRHMSSVVCFSLMNFLPLSGTFRYKLAKLGGIKFNFSEDKPWIFIGKNVTFDTVYPNNITIHNGVHITSGVTLLTHCLDTKNPDLSDIYWIENHITIKKHAFIGTNSIICSNVIIGEGAIIGAGSIVTKNIPDYEVWAGNPAKFIKKRG